MELERRDFSLVGGGLIWTGSSRFGMQSLRASHRDAATEFVEKFLTLGADYFLK